MATYTFRCPEGHTFKHTCSIKERPATLICGTCEKPAIVVLTKPPIVLKTIVADYPGAKEHKAGYQRTHGNFAAEKISMGASGRPLRQYEPPKRQIINKYGGIVINAIDDDNV
jgi:hypothetical protein